MKSLVKLCQVHFCIYTLHLSWIVVILFQVTHPGSVWYISIMYINDMYTTYIIKNIESILLVLVNDRSSNMLKFHI